MKTKITNRDRALLAMHSKRPLACTDPSMEEACRALVRRGLMRSASVPAATPDGEGRLPGFAITSKGRNVLAGKAAGPLSEIEKKDRAWRAGTKRRITQGVKCDWRGCKARGVHGHHKRGRGCGDYSDANRVTLCEEHHRWVTDNKREAIKRGYSESNHDQIQPVADAAPSQRRTA